MRSAAKQYWKRAIALALVLSLALSLCFTTTFAADEDDAAGAQTGITVYELTCGLEEHLHDKTCAVPQCGIEDEAHIHDLSCYYDAQNESLTCEKAEHVHTMACYTALEGSYEYLLSGGEQIVPRTWVLDPEACPEPETGHSHNVLCGVPLPEDASEGSLGDQNAAPAETPEAPETPSEEPPEPPVIPEEPVNPPAAPETPETPENPENPEEPGETPDTPEEPGEPAEPVAPEEPGGEPETPDGEDSQEPASPAEPPEESEVPEGGNSGGAETTEPAGGETEIEDVPAPQAEIPPLPEMEPPVPAEEPEHCLAKLYESVHIHTNDCYKLIFVVTEEQKALLVPAAGEEQPPVDLGETVEVAALEDLEEALSSETAAVNIVVTAPITVNKALTVKAGHSVTISGKTLTRVGSGSGKKLTVANLFIIEEGGTLTLHDITLQGGANEGAKSPTPIVCKGTLNLNEGAVITGFTAKDNGGGLTVNSTGVVTINGGVIAENRAAASTGMGGGIYIKGGNVTMYSGEIRNNTSGASGSRTGGNGGGVYIAKDSSFIFNGGTISENDAGNFAEDQWSSPRNGAGGGIYVATGAAFCMNGGTISNNRANAWANNNEYGGGGIYIRTGSPDIQLIVGTISGNTTNAAGGGIHFDYGELHINQAAIINNHSESTGGGIWYCDMAQNGGKFYATNGCLIAENTADSTGREFTSVEPWYIPKDIHLATRLPDGTKIVWSNDEGKSFDINPETDLQAFLDAYQNNITIKLANNAKASTEGYDLIIKDNSGRSAGGIGCNGNLILGEDRDITIHVEKAWQDGSGNTIEPPVDSVVIEIYRGSESTPFDSLELNNANDWKGSFIDLPADYDYCLREATEVEGFTPSYTYTDSSGNTFSKDQIKTEDKGEYTMTITNAPKPNPAEVSIPVKKVFTGRDLLTSDVFSFTIQACNELRTEGDNRPEVIPMPEKTNLVLFPALNAGDAIPEDFLAVEHSDNRALTAGKTGSFNITYEQPGLYHYTISEDRPTASGIPGVTYDPTIYHVIVAVTANETSGALEAKVAEVWSRSADDESAEWNKNAPAQDITFTNSYSQDEIIRYFRAQKTLTGGSLTAEQFTFILEDQGSIAWNPAWDSLDDEARLEAVSNAGYAADAAQPMPASSAAANGSAGWALFEGTSYTAGDAGEDASSGKVYHYTIREEQPTQDGTMDGAPLPGAVKNEEGRWVYNNIVYSDYVDHLYVHVYVDDTAEADLETDEGGSVVTTLRAVVYGTRQPEFINEQLTTDTTRLTVNKVWVGDTEASRPESITVALMRGDTPEGEAVTLTAENGWTYTWENLEILPEGESWSVREINVPEGYTSRVSAPANGVVTITNTLPDNPPPDDPYNPPPTDTTDDNPPPERPEEPPVLPELPDPNEPDSPDTVTIYEDDVPTTYVKVQDPESEEFMYIPEDDIPLYGFETPETGDTARTALWAALSGASLLGAAVLLPKKRKKETEE